LTDVGGSATICPTGLSDWSDRQSDVAWVGPTGRSDDRIVQMLRPTVGQTVEESNMFDFIRLPIRLSKRVDTTSDWSDRLASRTTNHAAA